MFERFCHPPRSHVRFHTILNLVKRVGHAGFEMCMHSSSFSFFVWPNAGEIQLLRLQRGDIESPTNFAQRGDLKSSYDDNILSAAYYFRVKFFIHLG